MTEAGKAFVRQADSILRQVDALDETFRVDASKRLSLRISLTRSYQVLRAISDFINENDGKPRFQLVIRETNPFRVLEDVRSGRADVGFLHFYENQQEYFQHCMRTYHLRSISSYRRRFLLAMSTDNPLARVPHIERAMLSEQIAVLYGDYESQMAPYANAQESFLGMEKRICVYDRSTAMDLLCRCPNTYTLITGLHPVTLSQYGLVLRECSDWEIYNIGCGIYPADVKLSAEMDCQLRWSS